MTARDPSMGKKARPRPRLEWDMAALLDRCDEVGDCLLWRNAVNSAGAPTATVDGVPGKSMRRVVYTQVLGKTIQPGKIIRARCGDPRCLGGRCLFQTTRALLQVEVSSTMQSTPGGKRREQQKAIQAGFAKLNPQIAAEIRASDERTLVLARRYGVNVSSVRRIRSGASWAVHSTPTSVFNFVATL